MYERNSSCAFMAVERTKNRFVSELKQKRLTKRWTYQAKYRHFNVLSGFLVFSQFPMSSRNRYCSCIHLSVRLSYGHLLTPVHKQIFSSPQSFIPLARLSSALHRIETLIFIDITPDFHPITPCVLQ